MLLPQAVRDSLYPSLAVEIVVELWLLIRISLPPPPPPSLQAPAILKVGIVVVLNSPDKPCCSSVTVEFKTFDSVALLACVDTQIDGKKNCDDDDDNVVVVVVEFSLPS